MKCGTCQFYDRGDCKRFPPTVDRYNKWPHVNDWDWCGEYKEKYNEHKGKKF